MKQIRTGNYKKQLIWLLYLLPGTAGLIIFYLWPHITVFQYAFSGNDGSVFGQFISCFKNQVFFLAMKNTLIMTLGGSLLLLPAAVYISLVLSKIKSKEDLVKSILLLSAAVPCAAEVIWIRIFLPGRLLDEHFHLFIILLYVWKYIGYFVLLLSEGLRQVPEELMETSAMEGAGEWWIFFKVQLPYLAPSLFFSFLLSVMNSFRMFREIYLLYGDHPLKASYSLSHFINNALRTLDYPKMSAAALLAEVVIVFLALVLLKAEHKTDKDLES